MVQAESISFHTQGSFQVLVKIIENSKDNFSLYV